MNKRELLYFAVFDGTVEDNLRYYGYSSELIKRLKSRLGLVKVNGNDTILVANIKKCDSIYVCLEDYPKPRDIFDKEVNIVYDDEDIAVIDKSADIAVIETRLHYGKSLANALQKVWGDFVYRPINRLDRQTSGLMAVAKNAYAHSVFSSKKSIITRKYLAVVHGILTPDSGVIDEPIGRVSENSVLRKVSADGQYARTNFQVVERFDDRTLVSFELDTGRTHQIRVHSAYLGCPLMGDDMYGGKIDEITRHALHSCYISFTHPVTNARIELFSDMPEDMKKLISKK